MLCLRLQQSADDPVVRISTLYRIKKKKVFITVDYMGDRPQVSAAELFCLWKPSSYCCPVLCTVSPLAYSSCTEEETAFFLLEGGWPLPRLLHPLPPSSVLLLLMQAGERGVENGLFCLVTSVPFVTNAGSAPHPLEIG